MTIHPSADLCPLSIRESLQLYVEQGIETMPSFLRSVLENDLRLTIAHATSLNLAMLPHITTYIYQEIPSGCWGSKGAVELWLESKARERKENKG